MLKLPFKFKSKDKQKKFFTIDIGSNDVKVMYMEAVSPIEELSEQSSKVEILGVSKQPLSEEATRGGVIIDMEEVEKALDLALVEATNGDVEEVSQAIFGASGTLSIGLMTTAKVVRGKKEAISQKEIDGMLDKTNNAAYEEAQNLFLGITGDSELDFQMITSSIVYTRLDGKNVDNLVGLEGQNAEIAVFTAFTPQFHLESIQGLAGNLGLDILAVAPNMYSLAKSLSYSKGDDFDGVLMDVGGELTDVAVIFGGGIVSTRALDVGGHEFTKILGKALDLPNKDAETRKLEYSYGRLPDSDEILIKGYMDNLLDVWLDGIELLFRDFTGVKTFAPDIYMVGGGSELPDIYDVVTKEPWSKSIPFKSPPEFSKLSIEDFPLIIDKTGKVASLEYVIPATLSIIYLEVKGLLNE